MKLHLDGKTAFITGGTHGIGLAIAHSLGKEGCNLFICARGIDRLKKVRDLLKTTYAINVEILSADALKPVLLKKAINSAVDKFLSIDILINNVGGGGRWGSKIPEETDIKVWREVYEKNAMAAIECTMQVLPKMIENKWGRVITISSVLGYEGGGRPWFNMAKSAEKSLMKTLSLNKRYATKNITFNTIAPGPVKIPDTGWDKFEKENPEEFKKIIDKLPAERFIIPEEIATLVTFLSSDRASGISGQHIRVDCGQTESF